LIDCIADLLASDEPRALAERMIDAVLAYANGRRAALFQRDQGTLRLFASRGLDQPVLDVARATWSSSSDSLSEGQASVVQAPGEAPEAREALVGAGSFAVVPVLDGNRVIGLLYVDSVESRFTTTEEQHALSQFARIASMALSTPERAGRPATLDVEGYLERTPPEDIAREQLLVLLDRHEWNISRVARVIGVTRQTIYTRLQRYGIERQRIPKVVLRNRQPA
jgi:transcriptional regulator with GAF, ATPase, and Fis domain